MGVIDPDGTVYDRYGSALIITKGVVPISAESLLARVREAWRGWPGLIEINSTVRASRESWSRFDRLLFDKSVPDDAPRCRGYEGTACETPFLCDTRCLAKSINDAIKEQQGE